MTIVEIAKEIEHKIDDKGVKNIFVQCFLNTIQTTVKNVTDKDAFIITGDIPAMWLRDSSAQVTHYMQFANKSEEIKQLIIKLLHTQVADILLDPYANAFNEEENSNGHQDDNTEQGPKVWERKYEIDSLCYPIRLAYLFWSKTGLTDMFDTSFFEAMHKIYDTWKLEQNHENSPYYFERANCVATDTLPNGGRGNPVKYTGMTWSGFRPSDDACTYGYLIPANMFAVVVCKYMAQISREVYGDTEFADKVERLGEEIDCGIKKFGIVEHEKYGKIYAYEVDGLVSVNLMDDANVPSLLSAPYLGYCSTDDELYTNTRRYILSEDNPYYFQGEYAKGVGSPHTPKRYIWHIALAIQGLTAQTKEEKLKLLKTITSTDAGTGFMHEGFDVDDPQNYTRPWFAWANSIFSELVMQVYIGEHDEETEKNHK